MKKIILQIIKKIDFLHNILFNYDIFKYINHRKWIFKIYKVKNLKLTFLESKEQKEDKYLLKKIQREYVNDIKEFKRSLVSDLWLEDISNCSKKNISNLFLHSSPDFLSKTMNSIFKTNYMYGLSSGSAFKYQKNFLGKKIWSLKYYDIIISFCEYLSIINHESFSQGNFAYYIDKNITKLIKKIKSKCKVDISFPNIGSPYGININNNLITFENIEHLYASEKIWEYINLFYSKNNKKLNIVEIGGGYGGLARNIFLKKTNFIKSYSLVDLPLMLAYQKYFINKSIGKKLVSNKFKFLSPKNFFIDKSKIDIMINQNSFPEMNINIVNKYAKKFLKNFSNKNSLLISFNHEAFDNRQVLVPRVLENLKKFKRISRTLSWVRRDYVEEVYKIQN